MRGKVGRSGLETGNIRITPAYAGKRKSRWYVRTAKIGSPPPMRGKEFLFSANNIPRRITPAYAGKSMRRLWRRCVLQDHPRLCGEKFTDSPLALAGKGSPPPMRGKVSRSSTNSDFIVSGSPPPMRGKVPDPAHHVTDTGITPAYAGKSGADRAADTADQDHPRLCGEKAGGIRGTAAPAGSPPPMRGKVSSVRNTLIRSGITPAYAGKRVLRHAQDDAL